MEEIARKMERMDLQQLWQLQEILLRQLRARFPDVELLLLTVSTDVNRKSQLSQAISLLEQIKNLPEEYD